MGKQVWKAGNMVYPLPAVMVSTADKSGKSNILTIAWTGTICTNPAMVYISVRPERGSQIGHGFSFQGNRKDFKSLVELISPTADKRQLLS